MRARVGARIRECILIMWEIKDYSSKKCSAEDEFGFGFEIMDEAIMHDTVEVGG